MAQPGDRWLCQTGSAILGVLIARAAGEPFEQYLDRRLFRPLGMVDTGFYVPSDRLVRFTSCYRRDPISKTLVVYDDRSTGAWSRPPRFPSGGGGLVSTVDDLTRFGTALLERGAAPTGRILSFASVDEMLRDQLTPAQKSFGALGAEFFVDHGWGLGGALTFDASGRTATYSWDGG